MKWRQKVSGFASYVTDVCFALVVALFEDLVEGFNLEQSGGYLNHSLPPISLIKLNTIHSFLISFDFNQISVPSKIHNAHQPQRQTSIKHKNLIKLKLLSSK